MTILIVNGECYFWAVKQSYLYFELFKMWNHTDNKGLCIWQLNEFRIIYEIRQDNTRNS
jgi:hypothetical protein